MTTVSKNIKVIPTSEYDEIVRVVQQNYIDGLREGDPSLVAQAFHKDAIMYGYALDGKLLGGPVSNLYTYVSQNGAAPNLKTRLDIIGVTPTTAVVKVDMEKDAAGVDYTDYHTLIKYEGEWCIIAKTFHAYEQ
ncbi:hypothetical protein PT974_07345 [Cladobotryum mycophilum]|uniref:Nuclear transport factor 2 family protein n=1 Tax=Cladobotryum mycophilum TaxID=491253 RepID=A0ABR0SP29_9HYPO